MFSTWGVVVAIGVPFLSSPLFALFFAWRRRWPVVALAIYPERCCSCICVFPVEWVVALDAFPKCRVLIGFKV